MSIYKMNNIPLYMILLRELVIDESYRFKVDTVDRSFMTYKGVRRIFIIYMYR